MNEDQIRRFLERYGQALSIGDVAEITGCWEIPALTLADAGAVPVSDSSEIARYFERAVGEYHSQGLMTTQPQLEKVQALTDQLVSVDVRWSSFDMAGVERSSERSHYILRRGDDGQLRIQVALTVTT
jgi:hypothetical protein